MRLACLMAAAATIAMLSAQPAAAQGVRGDAQLGLGLPLLAYVSTSVESDGGGAISVGGETSGFVWGIREQPLLELGYGVTDMIVLGAIVQLGGESISPEGSDQDLSRFAVFIGPKIDLMFGNSEVQPFVGAAIGLTHSSASAGDNDSSATGFGLLGRVGLRYFAAPGLSLDPHLALLYSSASADEDIGIGTVEVTASSLNVGLFFALSGWL